MTDDQAPQDWQTLLDIFYELGRLDNPLHSAFPSRECVEKLLESALRSGKVPLGGCREAAFGELERVERIEGKIGAETEINIPRNEVKLRDVYLLSLNPRNRLLSKSARRQSEPQKVAA
jgi:hypothetical protein